MFKLVSKYVNTLKISLLITLAQQQICSAWLKEIVLLHEVEMAKHIKAAGNTRREAEYRQQFQCLPGQLHQQA